MAGRVTQVPVEVSGSGQTPNARVTQVAVEVTGQGQTPLARVTQLVVEVSSLYGAIYIDQTTRFDNVNTFPAGGTVATSGIPVVQGATFQPANQFGAPGLVDIMTPLPIVGGALFQPPNTFFIGGTIFNIVPPPVVPPGTSGGAGPGAATTNDRKLPLPPADPPNEHDALLAAQAGLFQSLMYPERGSTVQSLKGLGEDGSQMRERGIPLIQSAGVPGPDYIYATSRMFFEKGNIVTPGPGGDNLVLEFKVPTGYWGKILGLYLHYTGTGFVPGSGDIIWRVQIGSRWMKNFGNVTVNMGDFQNAAPLSEWQNLRSQRVVRVWVNVPNISGLIQVGLSRILVGVQGVYYSVEEKSGIGIGGGRVQ